MTFDEFLLSNEYKYDYDDSKERSIIKVKYNDSIDFLYNPAYSKFEYNSKLEFIGMFEKNSRKLYGNSYYLKGSHSRCLYSSLYECSIEEIYNKVINGANDLLKSYIEKNKNSLMKSSQSLFDKFISFESNYNEIKKSSIDDYIYDNESNIAFSVDSYRLESERRNIIMLYLQDAPKIIEKVYSDYINDTEKKKSLRWYEDNAPYHNVSVRDYIGVRLHEQKLYETLKKELEQNPNNEYKKKYDIIKSIKDLDAQMLTITIKHNDNVITFKYPKNKIDRLDYSEWDIPDLKIREQMKEIYKGFGYDNDNLFISEIIKIEYARKVLYEDQNMLNKQNIEQEMNEIDYEIN